jgi:hypothetical protein
MKIKNMPKRKQQEINEMNMPGFTAEASLHKIRGHYQSMTTQGYSSVEQGVVSQMHAGGLVGARGPFSGSCGCGPGFCCCILCYFDWCYFWCWSTIRVGQVGLARG